MRQSKMLSASRVFKQTLVENEKQQIKMSDQMRLKLNEKGHYFMLIVVLFSIIQLLGGHQVACQDFEDLNSKQSSAGSNQVLQNTFQPLNTRQHATSAANKRPTLSNRFAAPVGTLTAQASTNSAVFSSPVAQQATAAAAGGSAQTGSQQVAGVSNIEQLMKNALARTAKLNSDAAEPRQDGTADVAPAAASTLTTSRSNLSPQQAKASPIVEKDADKQSESSETSQAESQLPEEADKQTTVAQTTTTNVHDTVYSEQRFANLFARRNNNKKSKIQPTEQIKAKPTLPSFIKSLPDPKQFSANAQAAANQDNRLATPSSPISSFASQRVQQQNQGRLNLANQQKKAAITSTSAANASNKRANVLNGSKPTVSAANQKASTTPNQKANANAKSPTLPVSNNPFNRSQASNDPANVIAMARKRLLANNALESAKLKQQQQNKPAQ